MESYPPKDYSTENPVFVIDNWNYQNENTTYSQIQDIVANAPAQLDTLKELSDAINANPLFGQETVASIALKADDNNVVKLTGAQTIAGNKTYSNNVTINGILTTSGNSTFGDAESDTLIVNSATTLKNDVVIGDDQIEDILTIKSRTVANGMATFRNNFLGTPYTDKMLSSGLYLGATSSGHGILAVPNIGAVNGFQFRNMDKDCNTLNTPFIIYQDGSCSFSGNVSISGTLSNTGNTTFGDTESDQTVVNSYTWLKNDVRFGNDELTDTLINQCRSNHQAVSVFTDSINAYAGQTDIYATQGLYLGQLGGTGRAVLGCPNNGSTNGFQFSNFDKDGSILNTPFYITEGGVCVTNGKLQVSADEFKVVDGALVTLPVDSVSQSAVNGLTTDLSTITTDITTLQTDKADDSAVVHLSGDETIGGEKTFDNALKFNKSIVIGNGSIFEPDNTIGKLYCREGASISGGVAISGGAVIGGGLTVSSGASLNLPPRGVNDGALSTNIPLKDGTNVFSGVCGFSDMSLALNGSFSMSEGSTLTLLDGSISDTSLTSNIPKKNAINIFTNNCGFSNLNLSQDGAFNMSTGSTLNLLDNSISLSAIDGGNAFVRADDSNTYALGTVQAFNGSLVDYCRMKNGFFEQMYVDLGTAPPPGQESGIFAEDVIFTTDRYATTTNYLNNLTINNDLNVIGTISTNAIVSGSKLVVSSGLNLRSAQTNVTSDLIGAGVVESTTVEAQDLSFTGNINNITAVELDYLDGVTSNIQTQLVTKAPLASPDLTGVPTCPTAISTTNTTQIASTAFVKGQISDLLGGAGPSIDTLLELNNVLAQADSDLSTNLTALIGTKAPIADPTFTGTVTGVSKAMVGLANVDNTNDASKPVSTAQQTALDLKANLSLVTNVDNTSDLNKPISTAQQSALDLKANASAITNIDNTSDASKPVSTAQQTALDLKADLSLVTNVDNTSDLDKPISTAQQTALDLKADATAITNIDNTSDASKPVSTAQQIALDLKADLSLVTNVDNTSDLDKPVSTAQQTALNLKADATAISNIDNTSDANKPVSTAQQTALDLKADVTALNLKADASAISNIDNTSDLDKPVSTAQQTALDLKADASAITNIDNTSDANKPVSTAQQTALDLKANLTLISNVDNTSDLDKPISTAQQTALDLKANLSLISNVDNTSDANKPVSTAQQTALDLKANTSALTYLDATSSIQGQLDAITSVDSSQQTAIDDRLSKASGGVVLGDVSSRSIVNLQEKLNTVSITANQASVNFANGGLFYVSGLASATNFEILLTNSNPTSSTTTSCIVTLLVDTSTYLAYGSTCKVNGVTRSIIFSGGATNIDITGATMVQQTLAVVYSGSSGTPIYVISSVVPYMA